MKNHLIVRCNNNAIEDELYLALDNKDLRTVIKTFKEINKISKASKKIKLYAIEAMMNFPVKVMECYSYDEFQLISELDPEEYDETNLRIEDGATLYIRCVGDNVAFELFSKEDKFTSWDSSLEDLNKFLGDMESNLEKFVTEE